MVSQIRKRDGRIEPFSRQKIIDAITSAMKRAGQDDNAAVERIADEIANSPGDILDVEQIQNMVEMKLMKTSLKPTAKEYIIYRNDRSRIRNSKTELMRRVREKLLANNVENQNANVDEKSFGGRIGSVSSEVMKQYALDECMSEMARNNHLNNEIYIHDLDHYAIGDHNCFQRNTEFITDRGVKMFSDFSDGDTVLVQDANGIWRRATVHYYGKQPMYDITFERCGKQKHVFATRNHRWILFDHTVTENIQIGDRLETLNFNDSPIDKTTMRYAEMFCFGFVLGDGCDHCVHGIDKIQARLCGEKMEYAKYFQMAHYRKQKLVDSNDVIFIKSADVKKQGFLDGGVWRMLSMEDRIAMFDGYMAADGSKTTNTTFVWTSDERMLTFIKEVAPVAGYYIHSVRQIDKATNYAEDRTLFEITLTTKFSLNTAWRVVSIKKQPNAEYEAWCIDEPVTHSFRLADGIITGNCLSIPFDDLLANGFNTRQTDVRPANSVNTAFQLVAVIFQLQSLQQFGGVSSTHLDWTMVPYVRKSFYKHYRDGLKYIVGLPDEEIATVLRWKATEASIDDVNVYDNDGAHRYALDMTEKEIHQAVEGMYHNLNTLQSRSGCQLPFTSINYGTCTLPEGRMIIKALLDVSIDGIGKLHRTPIFPCGIFQSQKGVNQKPGDPNYDLFRLALQSTARRLYPNYANVDWSGNAGYDPNDKRTMFSTMGCRTSNGFDINGFGQLKDGRGNICPVTIILPTLAMEAKEEILSCADIAHDEATIVNGFMNLLDRKIHEAKDMLIERYHFICAQSPDSAKFMYENNVMAGYDGETVESAMRHGTLVIGQLGLAEALQILIGCNHTTDKGMELAKRIEQLYKTRCAEFKNELKLNFGVYFTPEHNVYCLRGLVA